MHQIRFRLGLPEPAGTDVPPDFLAGFKGPTSKGKGRVPREGEWGSPTHYFRLKTCSLGRRFGPLKKFGVAPPMVGGGGMVAEEAFSPGRHFPEAIVNKFIDPLPCAV